MRNAHSVSTGESVVVAACAIDTAAAGKMTICSLVEALTLLQRTDTRRSTFSGCVVCAHDGIGGRPGRRIPFEQSNVTL